MREARKGDRVAIKKGAFEGWFGTVIDTFRAEPQYFLVGFRGGIYLKMNMDVLDPISEEEFLVGEVMSS